MVAPDALAPLHDPDDVFLCVRSLESVEVLNRLCAVLCRQGFPRMKKTTHRVFGKQDGKYIEQIRFYYQRCLQTNTEERRWKERQAHRKMFQKGREELLYV